MGRTTEGKKSLNESTVQLSCSTYAIAVKKDSCVCTTISDGYLCIIHNSTEQTRQIRVFPLIFISRNLMFTTRTKQKRKTVFQPGAVHIATTTSEPRVGFIPALLFSPLVPLACLTSWLIVCVSDFLDLLVRHDAHTIRVD